jgi:hypothetical protein
MPSSGMLRRMALVRTDDSEERIASINMVKRIGELGTMLDSDSDIFQSANWVLPGGSITTTIQHINIEVTYTIHISHTYKYIYHTK